MFKSFVVLLAFACAASAGSAHGGNAPGTAKAQLRPVTSFGYLDTNRDYRVSRDEAKADWAVAQAFSGADSNNDGYLDEAEFRQLSRG